MPYRQPSVVDKGEQFASLNMRIPAELRDRFRIYAAKQHRSMQGQIILLMERELEMAALAEEESS